MAALTKRTKRKPKPAPPTVFQHEKDILLLTQSVHALHKRVLRVEKESKDRVIHGFADATANDHAEPYRELEDIEDDGDVIG